MFNLLCKDNLDTHAEKKMDTKSSGQGSQEPWVLVSVLSVFVANSFSLGVRFLGLDGQLPCTPSTILSSCCWG